MGLLDRLLRRRPEPPPEYADDATMELLLTADDPARADSAVLAEAAGRGVDLAQPLLVRHHLVALPDERSVARAAELLAQDGYALSAPRPEARGLSVYATRTQVVTALSASQERSRMAGLAQRLGGDVGGWDALAPGEPQDG